ncbi:MAG: hypothetical protein ACTSWN_15150 [Promethearchaeota archaeon]
MPVNWFSEDEVKGTRDKWLEKYKSGEYDGANKDDVLLFHKALMEHGLIALEDDDLEYNELIEDAVMQYEELAIFEEIRDTDIKVVMLLKEDEQKLGTYSGNWKDIAKELGVKNVVQMEMIGEAMKQIMSGDPNTDKFFFAGTLTVDGPVKLAVLPREWITTFYEENGIEID